MGCTAELTKKGKQVRKFIQSDQVHIHLRAAAKLLEFEDTLENIWHSDENIWDSTENSAPAWLYKMSVDLIGESRTKELQSYRETISLLKKFEEEERRKEEKIWEEEQKKRKEERKEERERIRRLQEEKRQKLKEEPHRIKEVLEEEFEELVAEMAPKGFTHSKQVSNYIMRHRLGKKYEHISGILLMKKGGDTWKFNGGFPPDIYAKLCKRLGLNSQGTQARPVDFIPFKDL